MEAVAVVHYPARDGRLVLRTELDWELDIPPVRVSDDNTRHEFVVEADRNLLEVRLGMYRGGLFYMRKEVNAFVPLGTGIPFEVWPHFLGADGGRVSDLVEIGSVLGDPRRVRLYLPSGYEENTLGQYPVIYMQDGSNLFLPDEAFMGRDWGVDETMDLLDRMRLIRSSIVVGIHAQERMAEYTDVGYEEYGRSLKDEIKPWVDGHLRTLPGPRDTLVIGSSLGGVVSFFLGWEWPEVFGNVGCLSSTFGYKDDLIERVRNEELGARSDLKIYLDSGWPKDNYEATLTMAATLIGRGFLFGRDFLHCAFPMKAHDEGAWGERLHLPLQFFAGHPRRLSGVMSRLKPRGAPGT